MWKPVIASVALLAGLALSAPALAKTTWYVAQSVKTMNCIVTPTKPNGTSYMMIGTMTFDAASTAMKDMRSEDACKVVTKVAVKTTPKAPTVSATGKPQATTPSQPQATPPTIGGVY